ncbi:hypothetical protein D9615_008344 [Tricholomella constricta]|uniref:Uncharacterized protein n=1 Tax=Tricholomella constricta TaxID=117010 RepID=A0A8H5HDM7_9AGAR|nr:hypothetical protein D9615_008344 [Tricholomella constricta]
MAGGVAHNVVTWIGTCNSPRSYLVPSTPEYRSFRTAAHTLIVDLSQKNDSIDEAGPVFIRCLDMIARANDGQMYTPIDMLRIECEESNTRPSPHLWAVLGSLRLRYLHILIGQPGELSQPKLAALTPMACTGKSRANILPLPHYRYNLKYGTPQLFAGLRGLKIVHPLAMDIFVDMCQEFHGFAGQLLSLVLVSQPSDAHGRKRHTYEFGDALSQCTALSHLGLTLAHHDVDLPLCHMLPTWLSEIPGLVGFRFRGPAVMVRHCGRWIQCAGDEAWLRKLKSLLCSVGDTPETDWRNRQSIIGEVLAWETRFIDAMVTHRPDLKVLY